MTKEKKFNLETRWDKDVIPANEARRRGLLIDISALGEATTERRGSNLGLIVDRSGSMGVHNMEAAKDAAIGVVENLGKEDHLTVVDYDTEISVLVNGITMTDEGKTLAIAAIGRLHSRGGTALAAGWYEGAKTVADVIERTGFNTGHLVLISDGRANVGMTDPNELMKHASELADHGVTTSCVGIGDRYSPLQLNALAEGGRGMLHDASGGAEIIEVIMGELGEVQNLMARDVEVTIRWRRDVKAELLSRFDAAMSEGSMTVSVGLLTSSSKRTVPIIFDVPGMPEGEKVTFDISVTGKDTETGVAYEAEATKTELRVLPPEESKAIERDRVVAKRIARLWESTIGFEAMRRNEHGDFAGAQMFVAESAGLVACFAEGTGIEDEIRHNLRVAEKKVSRSWDGRSKREAMIAAKKSSRNEQEHREHRKGNWFDHM